MLGGRRSARKTHQAEGDQKEIEIIPEAMLREIVARHGTSLNYGLFAREEDKVIHGVIFRDDPQKDFKREKTRGRIVGDTEIRRPQLIFHNILNPDEDRKGNDDIVNEVTEPFALSKGLDALMDHVEEVW